MNSKDNIFSPASKKYLRHNIAEAKEQEVFFRARYDLAAQEIKDIRVVARGNEQMAPAIVNNLNPGDCVIHNHPSGDLRPSAADIKLASRLGNRGIGFIIINNEARDYYIVVEPEEADTCKPLPADKIKAILKSQGKLDQVMENFQEREGQLEILSRIITAFNDNETILLEAGTGIGKSFAYLLPAIFWSQINSGPVVVSTNTINLQQQLLEKDLVTLKKTISFDFKATLVKGRNNYLCQRKLYNALKNKEELQKNKELFRIINYLQKEITTDNFAGTKSSISFYIANEYWQEVNSESHLCLNNHCPYFADCYFQLDRKKIHKSDVLIVNHHLLLADAVLKNNQFSVLPDYQKLIIDEAHNLADVATQISGLDFYPSLAKKMIEKLTNSINSPLVKLRNNYYELSFSKREEIINILDQRIWPTAKAILELIKNYQQELNNLYDSSDFKMRIKEDTFSTADSENWQAAGEELLSKFNYLNNLMEEIIILIENEEENSLDNQKEQPVLEITGMKNRLDGLSESLALNINYQQHLSEYVFWLEKKPCYNNNIIQKNGRIEVAEFLTETLFTRLTSCILTSATLAIEDSFTYFKRKLGLKKAASKKVSSPFDYAKQAQIFAPIDIPEVTETGFISAINDKLSRFLVTRRGAALILFTSYAMLNKVKKEIKTPLKKAGISLLIQGEEPRNKILQSLRQNQGSVLLGTNSFWEGVDVPGEALSSLIIMRLPFAVPSDPLVAARFELIAKKGKNPFWNEALPQAIIKFKQGFGRLIRNKKDQGEVIILDKRIWTKSYGKKFINSLPSGCQIDNYWPDNP